ncbi:hypothetical protein [Rubrimonas cliftonensis]|uniref:Uncharacterized protein n=1 Tax=Rubrimonas cliftonensis TaxID=89524 RepID=A0A1H3X5Z2_9RHOB|nr:hypothetical protein [Rubrimonas cliftonensis]SDZ94074.1 hypothetical protein SAMN05444370_102264 [Rubrimonas cliftonensis]
MARFRARAGLIAALCITSPAAATAQDSARYASVAIGAAQAPVHLALVANASCDRCDDVFDALFDTRLLDGERVSPYAAALEAGRLRIVWRSWLDADRELIADLLARCSEAPGETMRRLSSAPQMILSFPHPATREPIPMTWREFAEILGPVLTPDLLSEADLLACPRDAEASQQVIGYFRAFEQEYPDVKPPLAFISSERFEGLDAIEKGLAAALGLEYGAILARRSAARVAQFRDAQAVIEGDASHRRRISHHPLAIAGAP